MNHFEDRNANKMKGLCLESCIPVPDSAATDSCHIGKGNPFSPSEFCCNQRDVAFDPVITVLCQAVLLSNITRVQPY